MNALIKNTVRRAIRTALLAAPVRQGARRVTHTGLVPREVWNRLPILEPAFVVELPGGGQFRYLPAPGDAIGQALYWCGVRSWEASTIRVFLELVRASRRFLDIGANTGPYTLLACAVNPTVRVSAYEPVPRICERLAANLAANGLDGPHGRVLAKQVAVAERQGTTSFHVPHSALPTSASLAAGGFRNIPGTLIEVQVTTVDADTAADAAARADMAVPVDLVKIDVEGFEPEVLAGMPRILAEDRPIIVCECNPDGPYERIEAILSGADYLFYHLRDPVPVRRPRIVPDASESHRNYACVPREQGERMDALIRTLASR